MPPPLTPAANLKVPLKPPPSVSPNTNLRIHRDKIKELIGSPGGHSLNDETLYSPAFKIVEDEHDRFGNALDNGFDIFDDDDPNAFRPATASPVKSSARRSAHMRRTSRILADITGNSVNKASIPALKASHSESPLKSKTARSPLRFSSTVDDLPSDDLFGLDFLDDEEPDDFGGLDILQGFSKIGSQKPTVPNSKPPRPGLGSRSHTSLF